MILILLVTKSLELRIQISNYDKISLYNRGENDETVT